MEFSVLKIELLFTLIQQFNLSLHIEQRKFQIFPPPGEQDHSNAPPQVQHTIKSHPLPTPCPALLFAIYFSETAWLTKTVGMTWSERLLMELISF